MKKYNPLILLTIFLVSFITNTVTTLNEQKSTWKKAKNILKSEEAWQVAKVIFGIGLFVWYTRNMHNIKSFKQKEQEEYKENQNERYEKQLKHGEELVKVFEPTWKHDLHSLGAHYCHGCPKHYTKLKTGCYLTIRARNAQEDSSLKIMYHDLSDFNLYKKSQNEIPWEVQFNEGTGNDNYAELSFLLPKEHIHYSYKNVFFE